MKIAARIVSMVALAATILPALLFVADRLSLPEVKTWMTASMVVWYVSAPFWIRIKSDE